MKIQVSNSNAPLWHEATVSADLPAKLRPLKSLPKTYGGSGTAMLRTFSATSIPTCGEQQVKTL